MVSSEGPAYQWYLDGDPLEGEVGQGVEALLSGAYSVEVIGENGCSAFSEAVDIIILGIPGERSSTFAIWPSPAQDELRVQIPSGNSSAAQLSILSSDGKLVLSERPSTGSITTLSLSGIAPGTYTLRFTSGDDRMSKRFVKLP